MWLHERTLRDEIVEVLKELGGMAHYRDIARLIQERGTRYTEVVHKGKQRDFASTVRAVIYKYSSDSPAYLGKQDYFYRIGGGYWGLRDYCD